MFNIQCTFGVLKHLFMKAFILTVVLALAGAFMLSALRLHFSFPFIAICFVALCLPFGLFSALLFSTPSNKEGVC